MNLLLTNLQLSMFLDLQGQIQGMVYIVAMRLLAKPILPTDPAYALETCTNGADSSVSTNDMTVPMLAFCGIGAVIACFFIIFFKTTYKRVILEAEQQKKAELAVKMIQIRHE